MRSPALALGWEVWAKNRAGWLACLGALVVGWLAFLGDLVVGVYLRWLVPGFIFRETVTMLSAVSMLVMYLYIVFVFTHPAADTRMFFSGFPARTFTLPIRTGKLVLLQMLYGIIALVLAWMATTIFIWWPNGIEPAWWLLPLLAVTLIWLEAICWSLPRSPFLQALVACAVFPLLTAFLRWTDFQIGTLFPHLRPPDRGVVTFGHYLALYQFTLCAIGAGFLVAVVGVWNVRHGILSSRARRQNILAAIADLLPGWQGTFASLKSALLWYEWRRRGLLYLPLFGACYLGFIALVQVPYVGATEFLGGLFILIGLLFMTAFCVGYGLGKPRFWGDLGLISFDATKPVTSGRIALSKIHAAAGGALLTCVVLALMIWAMWFGLVRPAPRETREFSQFWLSLDQFRANAFFPIIGVSVLALLWSQMVGGICLALTGRGWLVNSVAAFSVGLVVLFFVHGRVATHYRPGEIWAVWTGVASILVLIKFVGAGWMLGLSCQRGLMRFREAVFVLGLWLVGAASLVTLAHWILPDINMQGLVPDVFYIGPIPPLLLTLIFILAMPLLRLTAAPLAVEWSRHR